MPGLKSTGKLFRSREDFQNFHPSPHKTLFCLILIYVVVLFCLGSVWALRSTQVPFFFGAITYATLFCLIGWCQFALSNVLHEALHVNLFNKKSDLVASILTAYPIGLTMGYRATHQAHHKYLGTTCDPDFNDYVNFPNSRLEMLKRFTFNLCGLPAIKQFIQSIFYRNKPSLERDSGREIYGLLAVQLFIFIMFFITFGSIWYYFVFWIAPVATVGKFCSSTRLMCEHGSPNQDWVVRSIHGSRLTTWILGPLDFNYHAEHHIAQTIPFPCLKKLHLRHREIVSNAKTEDLDFRIEVFDGGYLSLIWLWFKELPWFKTNVA